MTRILILSAGDGVRWGNYLGVPKQLVPVDNQEPLLHRTVRELRARGLEDVHIVAADDELKVPGCSFFLPSSHRWIVETLLCAESIWGLDKTIILLGDVWYSQVALDSMQSCSQPYNFYGRVKESSHTGKGAEIFAMLFRKDQHEALRRILQEAVRFAEEGPYSVEAKRAFAMVLTRDKLGELQRILDEAVRFADERPPWVEAEKALAMFFRGDKLKELRSLAAQAGRFSEEGPYSVFESERARGKLWSVHRLWTGTPLSQMITTMGFQVIDDLTEDFDEPEEYDRWWDAKKRGTIPG